MTFSTLVVLGLLVGLLLLALRGDPALVSLAGQRDDVALVEPSPIEVSSVERSSVEVEPDSEAADGLIPASIDLRFDVEGGFPMPPRWTMVVGEERHEGRGPTRTASVVVEEFPVVISGEFLGRSLFRIECAGPAPQTVVVRPFAGLALQLDDPSDERSTHLYTGRYEGIPTRTMSFETTWFDATGYAGPCVDPSTPWRVVVARDGFVPEAFDAASTQLTAWTVRRFPVALDDGVRASGRVVDRDAAPIEGARVLVLSLFPEASSADSFMMLRRASTQWLGGNRAEVRTDADGRFRTSGIPPHSTLGIVLDDPRFEPVTPNVGSHTVDVATTDVAAEFVVDRR
ncbi:MAG: carboxypeptidase regulatory-like domain-containing protein [Planctomycetes bacterium]|nr:carboxypeptidase regulatory-like domain-containing protein [Planctomycetota bacterium]